MSRIAIWLIMSVVWMALVLVAHGQAVSPSPMLSMPQPHRSVVLTWRQPVTTVPVEYYWVYKANSTGAWVRVAVVDGLLRGWEDISVYGKEIIRYTLVAIGPNGAAAERSNVVIVILP